MPLNNTKTQPHPPSGLIEICKATQSLDAEWQQCSQAVEAKTRLKSYNATAKHQKLVCVSNNTSPATTTECAQVCTNKATPSNRLQQQQRLVCRDARRCLAFASTTFPPIGKRGSMRKIMMQSPGRHTAG